MSDQLKEIVALAKLMIQQEQQVALLEEQLAEAKREYLRINREVLPTMMQELELQELVLDSGERIVIESDVVVGIPQAQRAAAFEWLRERGYDGIIKTQVALSYTRGEAQKAREDAERIAALAGREPTLSEDVHYQTLRAFVKERLAAGEAVPFDYFGVVPFDKAKVVKKRK